MWYSHIPILTFPFYSLTFICKVVKPLTARNYNQNFVSTNIKHICTTAHVRLKKEKL